MACEYSRILAGAAFLGLSSAACAQPDINEILAELKRIQAHVAELEKRLAGKDGTDLAGRVTKLEAQNEQLEAALGTERVSEKEPELVTRLKDIEFRILSMQKQARRIESVEGISAGASLTLVAQRANGGATLNGKPESQLNYRADVSVTLPGGEMGNSEGHIFAHFRAGQGEGFGRLNPTLVSTPNSTAIQLTNADEASAILAQAWYQLEVPLPLSGPRDRSREHLEIVAGPGSVHRNPPRDIDPKHATPSLAVVELRPSPTPVS